jgi:hypothetical protein
MCGPEPFERSEDDGEEGEAEDRLQKHAANVRPLREGRVRCVCTVDGL